MIAHKLNALPHLTFPVLFERNFSTTKHFLRNDSEHKVFNDFEAINSLKVWQTSSSLKRTFKLSPHFQRPSLQLQSLPVRQARQIINKKKKLKKIKYASCDSKNINFHFTKVSS